MNKRLKKLGFKQVIRREWMDKIIGLILADIDEKDIRIQMTEYLSHQKQSGGTGGRSANTNKFALGLLSSWFVNDDETATVVSKCLELASTSSQEELLLLHWIVLSVNYPFFYNTCLQTGRILGLQETITQKQIFNRLKEIYGDKETVSRNARYAVRTLVAWGLLKESNQRGVYVAGKKIIVSKEVAVLLVNTAVLSVTGMQLSFDNAVNSPAFFSFQLPLFESSLLNRSNLEIVNYGPDGELLRVKNSNSNSAEIIGK